MKKKIIIGMAGIVALAAAAIVTVSTINANSNSELSDLMIKNLEALSQSESGADADCIWNPGNTCIVTVAFTGNPDGSTSEMKIETPDYEKKN